MPVKVKKRVILDSNFLMLPFQFNVDILNEIARILGGGYKIYVPQEVLNELNYLSLKAERLKDRKLAKMALEYAKRFDAIKGGGKDADGAIFALAEKDTIVCTNDKELKTRLREFNTPVRYLRQRSKLEIEGYGVS
ncbi:MAG: PIN domain-containing protein [Candidatus Hydrothermarchaeales archaeon]